MWFLVWCLGLMRISRHCYVEREDFGYFGSVFLARISDENEHFNPSYISLIAIPNFEILYLQPHSSNGQSLYSSGPPCGLAEKHMDSATPMKADLLRLVEDY